MKLKAIVLLLFIGLAFFFGCKKEKQDVLPPHTDTTIVDTLVGNYLVSGVYYYIWGPNGTNTPFTNDTLYISKADSTTLFVEFGGWYSNMEISPSSDSSYHRFYSDYPSGGIKFVKSNLDSIFGTLYGHQGVWTSYYTISGEKIH